MKIYTFLITWPDSKRLPAGSPRSQRMHYQTRRAALYAAFSFRKQGAKVTP